nr:glucose/ribitol dehydrogenase [Tanacetum cinerariifolium]
MTSQIADTLEPWHDLTGKVVFVTGASSGIGKELCLDLARAGCKIIACARRTELLKLLCDEINGQEHEKDSIRAFGLQLDVGADEDTIKAAVDKAWGVFGRIDALINNAGLAGQPRNPLEYEEKDWNYMYRINLTGSWLVAKHVCLHMRNAKQGGSVNISSITGTNRVYQPGAIAYASSKAAVNTMTKLAASMTMTNEKLAASQSKHGVVIKNLATQNEGISTLFTNTAKPENNMAKYFHFMCHAFNVYNVTLEEASTTLADTMAKCFPESTSNTMKPQIISKDITMPRIDIEKGHFPSLTQARYFFVATRSLEEIQVDAKLNFVEEPVEILEREFKKLKQSRIPIVK